MMGGVRLQEIKVMVLPLLLWKDDVGLTSNESKGGFFYNHCTGRCFEVMTIVSVIVIGGIELMDIYV